MPKSQIGPVNGRAHSAVIANTLVTRPATETEYPNPITYALIDVERMAIARFVHSMDTIIRVKFKFHSLLLVIVGSVQLSVISREIRAVSCYESYGGQPNTLQRKYAGVQLQA